jgi:tetratricopeptide (TPR) repeat protein
MSIPQTLEDRLKSGTVLPFIGTGVSMAVKRRNTGESLYPSWRELLEHAADRLVKEDKTSDAGLVRAHIGANPPEYLDAAGHARKGLGPVWLTFLRDEFARDRAEVEESTLDLAKAVWALGSRLIVTTNYDRVLSWACPSPDLIEWDIEATAGQAASLRGKVEQPTVWHLHGRIDNASEIVLCPDGYSLLYPENRQSETKYRAALETLRGYLASRTFLFIGFSLNDVKLIAELQRTNEIFKGATGPHYVLMRKEDVKAVSGLKLPVEIIAFPDFGQPMIDLVGEMCTVAAQTEAPNVATTPLTKGMTVAPDAVFYVPFNAKGDQVIGREGALDKVRNQLVEGHRTAIGHTAAFQGLGGLGKTQLAVEYAYAYKDFYPNGVIWITADQDIDAQLTDVAVKAGWIDASSEHQYKLAVAKHRLQSQSNCLVVFDNLEDTAAIADYLPIPSAQPHILVTSRNEHPGFTPIALDPLSEEESLKLLVQEAGRAPDTELEREAAREIAGTLGGLPLALEIAGAYLQYRPIPWTAYAELLRKNLRAALPGRFHVSFTKHEADLYSTLKIDDEVFESEPLLKPILDLLTWSGPSTMGLSLMSAVLDIRDASALADPLALGVALRLLQKEPTMERYAIHRLLREVRREEIPLTSSPDWVNDVCMRTGNWFMELRGEFKDLPRFEAEIDHLRSWQEHAVGHAFGHVPRLTWLQAYPPYHRGRYQESQAFLAAALCAYDPETHPDPLLYARLLEDSGAISHYMGDNTSALKLIRQALDIYQAESSEDNPDTARCLHVFAGVLETEEDYAEAEKHLTASREMYRRLYGERSDECIDADISLCVTLSKRGRYPIALERITHILDTVVKVAGEESLEASRAHNAAGLICAASGDYNNALSQGLKNRKVSQETWGPKHPNTATVLYNVGMCYHWLREGTLARKHLQESLDVRLEMLGEDHLETVKSRVAMGGLMLEAEDYQGASYELIRAIGSCARQGYLNRTSAIAHVRLERAMNGLGQTEKAYRMLKEFYDRFPSDHPAYAELRDEVRACQKKVQRPGFRTPSAKKGGKKQR